MLDKEFDEQYKVAVERGKEARKRLLTERVNRLKFFADTFQDSSNPVIEVSAYLVLESHQGRWRALWRYFRHAVRGQVGGWRFGWEWKRRFWWYRVTGCDKKTAVERACDALESTFEEDEEC